MVALVFNLITSAKKLLISLIRLLPDKQLQLMKLTKMIIGSTLISKRP